MGTILIMLHNNLFFLQIVKDQGKFTDAVDGIFCKGYQCKEKDIRTFLEWIQKINSICNRASAIVNTELIC